MAPRNCQCPCDRRAPQTHHGSPFQALCSTAQQLPIQVIEIAQGALWGHVLTLAREHGLSAYDAAYLGLAMKEGLPIATQDKALRKASRKAGILIV